MFLVMKTNNHFQFIYQKKNFENEMNLLLTTKDENKHYVLIKDFNKFMYSQTKQKIKSICVCIVCNVLVIII